MPWKTSKPHDSDSPIGRHVDIYPINAETGKRAQGSKHHQDIKVSFDENARVVADVVPRRSDISELSYVSPQEVEGLEVTAVGRDEISEYENSVNRYNATIEEIGRLKASDSGTTDLVRHAQLIVDRIREIGDAISRNHPNLYFGMKSGYVSSSEFANACERACDERMRELAGLGSLVVPNRTSVDGLSSKQNATIVTTKGFSVFPDCVVDERSEFRDDVR